MRGPHRCTERQSMSMPRRIWFRSIYYQYISPANVLHGFSRTLPTIVREAALARAGLFLFVRSLNQRLLHRGTFHVTVANTPPRVRRHGFMTGRRSKRGNLTRKMKELYIGSISGSVGGHYCLLDKFIVAKQSGSRPDSALLFFVVQQFFFRSHFHKQKMFSFVLGCMQNDCLWPQHQCCGNRLCFVRNSTTFLLEEGWFRCVDGNSQRRA